MTKKVIAVDLDGTLLNSDSKLSDTQQKSIMDKSIFCEQSSSGILFPNFESLFLTSK